jgi:lysyl-tRNA synthetase class 2
MPAHPDQFEQDRRQKLLRLRELGVEPFGGPEPGIVSLVEARASHKPEHGHDGGPVIKVAGRIMLKRDMGKLSFLTLRDQSGDLQIGVDRKRVDDRSWEIRDQLDLGDLVIAEGPIGQTNKGETTIWATSLKMAAKALLPPPAKHEGLADLELRYRQRYVDLWANPPVMKLAQLRSAVLHEVRTFLRERGYVEVETPMMQPIAGGAAARPFVTHHNTLDIPLYMRIAPELYLKRLLVGGFTKIFELNRNFRNEGISPRHNPEFTMLEAYEAFGSYETMAELVESLICHVAQTLLGTLSIEHKDDDGKTIRTINLTRPWRRVRMTEIVHERTGWQFDKRPLQEAAPHILKQLQEKGSGRAVEFSAAEQLVEVFEKLIEPTIIDPCFVTHVPSIIIPLARENRDDPYFADVYELVANGQELSPGYSELNDPDLQAKHLSHQVGKEEEKQKTDEDFLNALRHGMPPAGGLGLGIDRLIMMLTGAQSLRDVILFPLMKPKE